MGHNYAVSCSSSSSSFLKVLVLLLIVLLIVVVLLLEVEKSKSSHLKLGNNVSFLDYTITPVVLESCILIDNSFPHSGK